MWSFLSFLFHVLLEPVEHVCPGLQDARFVRGVDVLSLAVGEPMSLTRKDLHLVISSAFLLQLSFKETHLKSRRMSDPIVIG